MARGYHHQSLDPFSGMGTATLIARGLRKVGRGFCRLGDLVAREQPRVAPPSSHEVRLQEWFAINGDGTLRVEYDLDASSVLFDLGGFRGDWAAEMFARYGCRLHVFEPCPAFCADIRKRFSRNPHVAVHEFGLGGRDQVARLALRADGSSTFRQAEQVCDVRIVRAQDFFAEHQVAVVDVMKVNIEGGEYELLEHLIATGLVRRIRNLQVQFHQDVVPDAVNRMRAIQADLPRTHTLTYQYEFIWENWRLREPG